MTILSHPVGTNQRLKHEFQTGQVAPVVAARSSLTTFILPALPQLLPVLIEKLSLSLTQAGALSACLQIPSLLNPLIGYLADRMICAFSSYWRRRLQPLCSAVWG